MTTKPLYLNELKIQTHKYFRRRPLQHLVRVLRTEIEIWSVIIRLISFNYAVTV